MNNEFCCDKALNCTGSKCSQAIPSVMIGKVYCQLMSRTVDSGTGCEPALRSMIKSLGATLEVNEMMRAELKRVIEACRPFTDHYGPESEIVKEALRSIRKEPFPG